MSQILTTTYEGALLTHSTDEESGAEEESTTWLTSHSRKWWQPYLNPGASGAGNRALSMVPHSKGWLEPGAPEPVNSRWEDLFPNPILSSTWCKAAPHCPVLQTWCVRFTESLKIRTGKNYRRHFIRLLSSTASSFLDFELELVCLQWQKAHYPHRTHSIFG